MYKRQIETLADDEEEKQRLEKAQRQYDEILKVNVAFKTIQIVGQIIRNFPGSLRGEMKREIALESYRLGLRTLKVIMEVFARRLDIFKKSFRQYLEEKLEIKDEMELKTKVEEICFLMALALAHGVIKMIAYSVGSTHLKETYKEVISKSPSTSFSLIDIAIKLDHSKKMPDEDIISLNRQLAKKMFAGSLLKQMVIQHLYLNDCDYRVMQRVCQKLGIVIEKTKLLEQRTKK